jgi:hypothetical protein
LRARLRQYDHRGGFRVYGNSLILISQDNYVFVTYSDGMLVEYETAMGEYGDVSEGHVIAVLDGFGIEQQGNRIIINIAYTQNGIQYYLQDIVHMRSAPAYD